MRAVVCTRLDGVEGLELQELPVPGPGPGELRVRVLAAGVNFADTLAIRGRYQDRREPPFVPGLELSGVVEALGPDVDGPPVGTRVVAATDFGAFAEYAVVRAVDAVPLPEDIPAVEAAGFPITYGTAHGALVWRARLRAGETVLVHGAAGGTGLAAVECAKALGARVIATARGEERLQRARAHGADVALDAGDPELVAKIRALTAPAGVHVAFDTVGGEMFRASLRTIAWEGRILVIGFASGEVPQIPANHLLVKNADAIGFWWGSYRHRDPARVRAGLLELLAWWREGRIRPEVAATCALEETPRALSDLLARRVSGKIVIRVAQDA
ncbi:2-haloacrylate reductase [bacterium HR39]|nr:2-haloacrylate reductase [bacterium HR39]